MSEHLSPQQTLAYIDGELSMAEARRVEKHLHSCWSCMTEMERMKADIATILDAYDKAFVPALPQPPGAWPGFKTILAQRSHAHSQSIPFLKRATEYRNWLLSPVRLVGLSVTLLFVFGYFAFHTRTVSAKEVLHRVYAADAERSAIGSDQVIRERIRVRKIARGQRHSVFAQMDAWKSPSKDYWDVSEEDSAAVDLEAEYQKHKILTGLPLSATSVDSWGREAGGNPTVSEHGSDLNLNYRRSSNGAADSVEQVNVLVQQATWQVKQMTLDFQDASYEIEEDDYSVMPKGDVPALLLAHLEPYAAPLRNLPPVAHPLSAAAPSLVRLPIVNLDKAELDVFTTLHGMEADLGEPVTVARSSGVVLVGLWQLPPGRKAELRAALAGKLGVQVELRAPHASPEHEIEAAPVIAHEPLHIQEVSGTQDKSLINYFGSVEKEQAFSSEVLRESTVILSHLYALRNLQTQFPTMRDQSLGDEEHLQLHTLMRDHATAISENLDALERRFASMNSSFDLPPCAALPATGKAEWQRLALSSLETAKEMDHVLRMLFTINQTPADPNSALPEIIQDLCKLRAELRGIAAVRD